MSKPRAATSVATTIALDPGFLRDSKDAKRAFYIVKKGKIGIWVSDIIRGYNRLGYEIEA